MSIESGAVARVSVSNSDGRHMVLPDSADFGAKQLSQMP